MTWEHIMRHLIGTAILFAAGVAFLSSGWLIGLIPLALAISALLFFIAPHFPLGVPGYLAAMLLGSIALVALLAVGINGFFDDC